MSIGAVIPARGGSMGVPGKNPRTGSEIDIIDQLALLSVTGTRVDPGASWHPSLWPQWAPL